MSYKLLIVEDEDIIRRGLVYSVDWQAMDCIHVWEAVDGREAVAQIEAHKPDIVIIDINIPFLNGLEVLEQTKERFAYSAIILTGYADFDYARRALKVGAVRFLLKPVNFGELAEAIAEAKKAYQGRLAYGEYRRAEGSLKDIDLLSAVGRSEMKCELVQQILCHVEEHYSEKLTLRDLAGKFHYSETFLIRKFNEEMKMGFSEYLSRYRIQKAILLLRQTDKRTETIAEECGFMTAKYFNAVFRKHLGCLPRDFIQLSQ